ncbi:hypothetical protein Tco_0875807 [Tanacetum coccineum]|uniref:Uncharacterized protein n=1 Tax=Tanacetum coccineum TaxID=301880 RepID=A0ABQ5BTC7_9ASTR
MMRDFLDLAVLPGGKNCARKRVVRSSQVEMDPAGRLRSDAVERVLTSSLANSDGVTRNANAASTVCKKFFKTLRVKFQSCPVSSQLEPKSRVFPSNAIQIESISTILTSLGSPMSNNDIVTYALQGLSEKFAHVADGTLIHYKARLVANDSTQLSGIDVDETFSQILLEHLEWCSLAFHSDEWKSFQCQRQATLRYQDKDCQGRLFDSFQDDIKCDHIGPKTQDRKKTKYYKDEQSRDLEPLSLDIKLLEIINLASSLDYLVTLLLLGFAAALAILVTRASQSRQHGKSESDLISHLPQSLFDVGSRRISIVTVNT